MPRARQLWNVKNWHWISSAICLAGMLLFAVTGITLNHAAEIESEPKITSYEAELPANILSSLQQQKSLTSSFKSWFKNQTGQNIPDAIKPEINAGEIYLAMPRPGGDSWFSLMLETGEFYMETTERGYIAYLNDLHKGRNTSSAWRWFIDIFSIACIVFTVTGLILLKKYAKGRKSTWPLIIASFLLPVAIALIPAHAGELKVEIPRIQVSEYHAPYVAAWISDKKHKNVQNIFVWYDYKMKDDEGEKWLKDMRLWWRRGGRTLDLPIDGVTGATRRPGIASVDISEALNSLTPGTYRLNVEAARELGGREAVYIEFDWPLTPGTQLSKNGQKELGKIQLIMENK
ncbi:PepSY-associated TM helix domain-containing protein [Gayadomonas joobiniege]|uniref:PepSY-associated TM helix domain-containing protein n=1 Tax=Gayadomonas joobiniege TaxID=1234606 RepID=UPI0003795355|nr:PepSY-associated TM helix domain-containing protein [Gayadomonas joobiniege]